MKEKSDSVENVEWEHQEELRVRHIVNFWEKKKTAYRTMKKYPYVICPQWTLRGPNPGWFFGKIIICMPFEKPHWIQV